MARDEEDPKARGKADENFGCLLNSERERERDRDRVRNIGDDIRLWGWWETERRV